MSSFDVPARPAAAAAITGGLTLIGLGLVAAVRPMLVAGGWAGAGWFVIAGLAIFLFTVAVLGLRTVAADVAVARRALAVAAPVLALFGAAHFYALADEDTAIMLFSVFMVAGSLAVVVAGVAVARAGIWRGVQRFVPLLCGVWPIATIPVGAAVGDLPHFLAIAVWGACWTALGVAMRGTGRSAVGRSPSRATSVDASTGAR